MLGSRGFWSQRALHPIARLLLIVVVSVLLCIAIGFIVATGHFSREDFLAIALYVSVAAFGWHPMTAAFIVMAICSAGVVFTGSGGDLLELAIAFALVAATCAAWVIVVHAAVLGSLTADIALHGSALTDGGVYGIIGIAAIAFLAGVAFRLVTAREETLIAERARVVKDLEAITRQEQERIADELHDGIAHDLTLVLFHARALPKQRDDAARRVSLTTIERSAEQALQRIQSLLSPMRDTKSESPGFHANRYDGHLVEAASSLGTLLKDAGIPTRVSAPSTQLAISSTVERLLTETAIEAVTNIIKHAQNSQSASIDIHAQSDVVELVVENVAPPTPAGDEVRSGGRGLRRAEQRLAQNGGQLESSRTSEGWILRATMPADMNQAI